MNQNLNRAVFHPARIPARAADFLKSGAATASASGGVALAAIACLLSPAVLKAEPPAGANSPGRAGQQADWRWVRGAVFVPTACVNEAQQWDEYNPAVNDRELHYASVYGINCVRVYLHYAVYLKKKEALLRDIEDFLTRADRYGIRTELVFFDDCWNQPDPGLLSTDYKYPGPIFGVHNSRWLVCPGEDARRHYAENRGRLKDYVQDIVKAHKQDRRIAFWETYNEPNASPETRQLLEDSRDWIHETGTPIPLTATGRGFAGDPYSDFKSWHEYGGYDYTGTPGSLCTECMNRSGQTVPGIVEHFKDKTGFILWEFGIGRDNCRFSWDENRGHPRKDEPPRPFHGVVYPDGHPWSIDDVKALLGAEAFAAAPLFAVEYFRDPHFSELAKRSVTPMIDFDLGTEPGTSSPDASARVPEEDFSTRWTGTVLPPSDGVYAFHVDGDNRVKVFVRGSLLLDKTAPARAAVSRNLRLAGNQPIDVKIEYVHATGGPSLHVAWSGPGFQKRILTPMKNAGVP